LTTANWKATHVINIHGCQHLLIVQGVSKNDPTCFCQNFVKSPPNLIIYGTQSQDDRNM